MSRPAISSAAAGVAATARSLAERHPAVAGTILFGALAAVSRPASFRTPIERDTGQYLYVGQAILDGDVPYADAANNKGPATFLLFAGLRLVSGTSVVALRLTLLVFTVLAALALAAYVTRLAGRAPGVLAGATFAVLGSTTALQGEDPNTEQYAVAPMVGAWFLAARGGRLSALGAGALTALAALMNAGFVAIAPIVAFEIWRANSGTPGAGMKTARSLGLAVVGGLAVAAPVLGWLGAAGALDDLRHQVIAQATDAVSGNLPGHLGESRVDSRFSLRSLLDGAAGALWMGGLVGAALALLDSRLRAAAIGAIVWIVVMWARVKVSGYSFSHHYYLGMPGIAAGLALGIASIWGERPRQRAATATLVLTIPVWAFVVGPQWRALDIPASERWGPNSSFSLAYPVADFVEARTHSSDRVLVNGAEPEVYWLAKRRAPTRFFDVFPIYWRPAYAAERRRTLLDHPPRAIAALQDTPLDPDVAEVLDRYDYELAYERQGARVWLRRSRAN